MDGPELNPELDEVKHIDLIVANPKEIDADIRNQVDRARDLKEADNGSALAAFLSG